MIYKLDGHKINYHPDIISKYLEGKELELSPVNIEISPSGACNLRCVFCSQSFLKYKPQNLEEDVVNNACMAMAKRGLKAVVMAGEGEPLINSGTPNMIQSIRHRNIDVAMSTNAGLMDRSVSKECLGSLTWVRISLNAGSNTVYNKVHQLPPESVVYEQVIRNIADMVDIKKRDNLKTTIGVQLVMVPDNAQDIIRLAKQLRELQVDYFTIKPFSKHPKSEWDFETGEDYCGYSQIKDELYALQSPEFSISAREESFRNYHEEKSFSRCYGAPLWAYISSNADMWPCLAYIGDPEFYYGNLKQNTFDEVWDSEQRKRVTRHIYDMDISGCRKLCRLEYINQYLQSLKNEPEHVNFI